MKRFALLSFVMILASFAGVNVNAEEAMTEQEVAAMEASLFANFDTMDSSSDAKFAQELESLSGNDGAAKCWFWCWRRPVRFVYPTYYYYTWYCPVYYVPLRIVTYSIPVIRPVPVVQTVQTEAGAASATAAAAAATATATATATAGDATATASASANAGVVTKFLPSSGRVSKGAVIDAKVPQNSPLFKMGLRSGDIITSVDGTPVQSMLDARRIKANSSVTYVRGDQIKVAGKPILQNSSAQVAQAESGAKTADLSLESVKSMQASEMSLYEYYDSQEKAAAPSTEAPAKEYGADEY